MNPGTVFQIIGDGFHIMIVVSKAVKGRVLICNLSDDGKCPKSPCFFDAGDHPWITKRSGIALRYLTTLPVDGFPLALEAHSIRVSEDLFPEDKLKEICDGLLASTAVSEALKEFLR